MISFYMNLYKIEISAIFIAMYFKKISWGSKVHFYLVHDIKPPNNQSCFPQFFPQIFLSFSCWKRKQTFYLSKTDFFLNLGPMKSLFSFSTAQTEKSLWKKLENEIGCLVVWCHEPSCVRSQWVRSLNEFYFKAHLVEA